MRRGAARAAGQRPAAAPAALRAAGAGPSFQLGPGPGGPQGRRGELSARPRAAPRRKNPTSARHYGFAKKGSKPLKYTLSAIIIRANPSNIRKAYASRFLKASTLSRVRPSPP